MDWISHEPPFVVMRHFIAHLRDTVLAYRELQLYKRAVFTNEAESKFAVLETLIAAGPSSIACGLMSRHAAADTYP